MKFLRKKLLMIGIKQCILRISCGKSTKRWNFWEIIHTFLQNFLYSDISCVCSSIFFKENSVFFMKGFPRLFRFFRQRSIFPALWKISSLCTGFFSKFFQISRFRGYSSIFSVYFLV